VHIDWPTLAAIAVVAAAATVTVVLLVSFAVLGLSASPGRGAPDVGGTGGPHARSAGGPVLAVLCLAAATAVVGYGLYLIIA
jgi:hypothetical protein